VLVVVALMAAGYLVQLVLLNRVMGKDILPPLLVTFGMSIITQNALLEVFSADSHKIPTGGFETMSLPLGAGLAVGLLPLGTFLLAVAVIGTLQFVFYHTSMGRLLRASSDDGEIVPLMGRQGTHVFALTTMLASIVVAIAGMALAVKTNFDPSSGPTRLLFAFEAVIIGGLGNPWGRFLGGVILGVAQAIGGQIDAGYQMLAGDLVFLLVLVVRPNGLFPKMREA